MTYLSVNRAGAARINGSFELAHHLKGLQFRLHGFPIFGMQISLLLNCVAAAEGHQTRLKLGPQVVKGKAITLLHQPGLWSDSRATALLQWASKLEEVRIALTLT